jgi:hypothetical protein
MLGDVSSVANQTQPRQQPNRPTVTWKVWPLGIAGACLVVAVLVYWGSDDVPGTRQPGIHTGTYVLRGLFIAGMIVAGWLANTGPEEDRI